MVKVWVSIAQSARASERKSDDLGSIPSRDTDFLLRLSLTALRVPVTPSRSFIYPPRVICFSRPHGFLVDIGLLEAEETPHGLK